MMSIRKTLDANIANTPQAVVIQAEGIEPMNGSKWLIIRTIVQLITTVMNAKASIDKISNIGLRAVG